MVDEPSAGHHYGGTVAAPVFSRITEGTLRTLGVAPDMPLTPLQLARRGADEAASAGVGRENM